jgi:hypothetical protein
MRLSLASARLAGTTLLTAFALSGCAPEETSSDVQEQGEGPALAYSEYTVLFTNPECRRYLYGDDQVVTSESGERLTGKPRGAWCTPADSAASGARPESPQSKLVSWIDDPSTEEIFLAYFTMSNAAVTTALCRAIEERDVRVTLVLDKSSDLTRANQVAACAPASGEPERAPRLLLRGGEGSIALQHNKVFLINPRSESPRVVFSSGNLTSGVVLHHENWHFVAPSADTYFAKAHLCLIEGLESHASSKREYSGFIRSCKDAIPNKEERDLKTFFVPGEGDRAFSGLQRAIRGAEAVDVAAHRFTHKGLVRELSERLEAGVPVRLVADDDLYWASKGQVVGGNDAYDAQKLSELLPLGLEVRYVESNHVDKLLHHNKLVLASQPGSLPDQLFAGSGNFTGSGFSSNFENYYLVSIPEVTARLHEQFDHLHDTLATAPADMPTELVAPSGGTEP